MDGIQVTLTLLEGTTDAPLKITGTTSVNTASGTFTFTGIKVIAVGTTYSFKATLGSFSGVSSGVFTIDSQTINAITFTLDQSTYNAYKYYTINVNAKDANNEPFIISSNYSLSLSDSTIIGGTSSAISSTGSQNFANFFFKTAGIVTFTVKVKVEVGSDEKTETKSITINAAALEFQSFTV